MAAGKEQNVVLSYYFLLRLYSTRRRWCFSSSDRPVAALFLRGMTAAFVLFCDPPERRRTGRSFHRIATIATLNLAFDAR